MTRQEIIQMARQAGFLDYELDDGTTNAFDVRYEAFARLAAEHEREACAKVCDDRAFRFFSESPFFVEMHGLAEAIRARGQE